MVQVHTARLSYCGPDRLDITRKSARPEGLPFAPSWAILGPMLKRRAWIRKDGEVHTVSDRYDGRPGSHKPPLTEDAEWAAYVAAYTVEMRASYRTHRPAWNALLARGEVTLVCYCTNPDRCHRRVLAGILVKLGAGYVGERA